MRTKTLSFAGCGFANSICCSPPYPENVFASIARIGIAPLVCLLGVEPLSNIRDGVLVKRLVEAVRYVADVRRCQYVIERPEWVRWRQWLSIQYVDRRASDLPILQCADQSLLVDNRPARRIDQSGRRLHSS